MKRKREKKNKRYKDTNTQHNTLYSYRIAGNFHIVQTFTVFADGPTTAKIKTVKVLTINDVTSYYGGGAGRTRAHVALYS